MILHRCFVGEAGAPRAPCVSFCNPPPILSGVSAAGSIWAQWASVCRLRWDSEVNWELHLDLENHRALPPVSNASSHPAAGGLSLMPENPIIALQVGCRSQVCGLESWGFLVLSGNAWKSSPSVFQPRSPSGKQPAGRPREPRCSPFLAPDCPRPFATRGPRGIPESDLGKESLKQNPIHGL